MKKVIDTNAAGKVICGARNKQNGGRCQSPPMPNGRCRMHGGATPKGQKNALKHGIYSSTFTDSEREFLNNARLGAVDDEINLMRVQLLRACNAQAEVIANPNDATAGFVLSEITQESGGMQRKTKATRKRPDYLALIERFVTRIAQLEQTRLNLLLAGVASDEPDEVAKQIMDALADMDKLTAPVA